MVEEGKKAPTFKLESDSGEMVSLKDYAGKTVILFFYPKANTPGWTREACDFRDEIGAFNSRKAVVLGISKDSVKAQLKFREKYELPFPLLSDADGAVCEKYGVIKDKSMYGKIFKGIERSTFIIGENGKVVKVYRKVKVGGHVENVLGDL